MTCKLGKIRYARQFEQDRSPLGDVLFSEREGTFSERHFSEEQTDEAKLQIKDR